MTLAEISDLRNKHFHALKRLREYVREEPDRRELGAFLATVDRGDWTQAFLLGATALETYRACCPLIDALHEECEKQAGKQTLGR